MTANWSDLPQLTRGVDYVAGNLTIRASLIDAFTSDEIETVNTIIDSYNIDKTPGKIRTSQIHAHKVRQNRAG